MLGFREENHKVTHAFDLVSRFWHSHSRHFEPLSDTERNNSKMLISWLIIYPAILSLHYLPPSFSLSLFYFLEDGSNKFFLSLYFLFNKPSNIRLILFPLRSCDYRIQHVISVFHLDIILIDRSRRPFGDFFMLDASCQNLRTRYIIRRLKTSKHTSSSKLASSSGTSSSSKNAHAGA